MFETAISNLYSDRNLQAKNEDKLARLEQTKSAATYGAEFQSLVDPLDLGDRAKCLLFYKGLKSNVKDTIVTVGRATTFTDLLDQAISIDQRKHQRTLENKTSSSSSKSTFSRAPPPSAASTNQSNSRNPGHTSHPAAQVDPQPRGQKRPHPRGPLSDQEKAYRAAHGLCPYCGERHTLDQCPNKPKKPKLESVAAIGRYQAPAVAFADSENYQSQAPTRSAT